MAFKDLEQGVLEEFAERGSQPLYLRAHEDPGVRVKRDAGAGRDRPLPVVLCRLCGLECWTEQSLRGHWFMVHRAAHEAFVVKNKELAAAYARSRHPEQRARLTRRVALLQESLDAARRELALLGCIK